MAVRDVDGKKWGSRTKEGANLTYQNPLTKELVLGVLPWSCKVEHRVGPPREADGEAPGRCWFDRLEFSGEGPKSATVVLRITTEVF